MTASLEDLKIAYLGAIEAADPSKLVKAKIRTGALDDWFGSRDAPKPIHVVALGKAAPRMVWGLLESSVPFTGIGVTTAGQKRPTLEGFWHEGGHPVPTAASFAAGQAVFDWVDRLPAYAHVLVLLSGGASACVDVASDPDGAVDLHQRLLASGAPTQELNRERAARSEFKAGGLARRLTAAGADVRTWIINDLPPGEEAWVGSGPTQGTPMEVLADSSTAARGGAEMLRSLGHRVHVVDRIAGPIDAALDGFLSHDADVTLGAGEVDVALPADAPVGGRCHHAALLAARRLADGEVFLAGATDGLDGTTRAGAAWSLGGQWNSDWASAATRHDAHGTLHGVGQSLRIGSTGTNVNDVWMRTSNP